MMKTIATLSAALMLSACGVGQPPVTHPVAFSAESVTITTGPTSFTREQVLAVVQVQADALCGEHGRRGNHISTAVDLRSAIVTHLYRCVE